MKNYLIITCLVFGFFTASMAQNPGALVKGKVFDQSSQAIAFATVVLYDGGDSALVKTGFTDDAGSFEFLNIPSGDYFLELTFVGMENYSSPSFQLSEGEELEYPDISMQPVSKELQEVVVKGKKPILEVKPDKTVFNVEGSINATGSNAFELLRKAPGVIVDNNDNILLQGKNGVRIFIDGKPSPLAGEDLAAFLESLQSSEIRSIEIITNPSSKYEAEGNAGIIDIRLRKDKRFGTNGSISGGFAYGDYAKYRSSATVNHRDKHLNLFGSYGNYFAKEWEFIDLYREQAGQKFDQHTDMLEDPRNHNFRAGADWFLNKNSTLGLMVNGYFNNEERTSNSRAEIGPLNSTGIDSILLADNTGEARRSNMNFNLNYRFEGKEKGGVLLNMDADFGFFRNRTNTFQPNTYTDPTEEIILRERNFATDQPTDIDIATFKTDYERDLLGGKLGAGLKVSYVETRNTYDFFNIIDGDRIVDIDRTNKFDFTEQINAGYVNFQKNYEKWGFQAGLRVEQTNSLGDLESAKPTPEDRVERHYLDFFPSGGLTFQPSQKHALRLTYSRRIDRPSYQDLNPFEFKLDELTFEKGNPFLKPQYTDNIQLSHTFNYSLNTTLGYSLTHDYFTGIVDTLNSTASFLTYRNLSTRKVYNLNISYPFAVTKWWNAFVNLGLNHVENKDKLEEGKEIDLKVNFFNIYSQHSFKLPYDLSLEVSGFYNSPATWGGNFETDDMWSVDVGLQKKLMDGRATVKISVTDIFYTQKWSGTSELGGLYLRASGGQESRQFRVNFTYSFGNSQVKGARKRKTGLEDEKSRVK